MRNDASQYREFQIQDIQETLKSLSQKQVDSKVNYFHLMTFNLRDPTLDKRKNTWEQRRQPTIQTIIDTMPDVIGTQEGQSEQFNEIIDGGLKSYGYEWFGLETTKNVYDSAIIYNKNTLILEDWGHFWLSEKPFEKFSKYPDSAMKRTCTYGIFKHKTDDTKFMLFNTHFDHVSEIARQFQAGVILEQIQRLNTDNLPVFITGDFNSLTNSQVYQKVSQAGYTDVLTIDKTKNSQNGQQFTFHAYLGQQMEQMFTVIPARIICTALYYCGFQDRLPVVPFPQNFFIDFVFQNNEQIKFEMIQNFVLTHKYNGQHPSDHYPISVLYKIVP